MKRKMIFCVSIIVSLPRMAICLSEVKSAAIPSVAAQAILASVSAEPAIIPSSLHEKEKIQGSPELSFGSPSQGRILERSTRDSLNNNSDSGNVGTGASFLMSDVRCRTYLYDTLQRNDGDRIKTLLFTLAFNDILEADGLWASYRTMRQLLPRFNELLKNALPPFPGYTYVDILCHFPAWHSALIGVFLDELRQDSLRVTPQALRARYYAVKLLERALKKLLQELLCHMASERQRLLTPALADFLNPNFIEQTFEDSLYEYITQELSKTSKVGSDAFEDSTQSIGTFEQLEQIESEGQAPHVARSIAKPLAAGGAVRSSSAPRDAQHVGPIKKRLRSPELSGDSPSKRRDFQHEGGASKENSTQNTPGSGSDSLGSMGLDFLMTNPKSRAILYSALQRKEYDHARMQLACMSCNKLLADPERVKKAHQIVNQLLPRFNEILKEGLHPYPGYTYVDILCNVPAWHESFILVFFDELHHGLLSPSPQVLRACYYAVKWLEGTLTTLLQEFSTLINSERPLLLTPSITCFLNPVFVPQTFEHYLYRFITTKLYTNEDKAIVLDRDTSERSTPEVSIFEQLKRIEKEGRTTLSTSAQTGSADR